MRNHICELAGTIHMLDAVRHISSPDSYTVSSFFLQDSHGDDWPADLTYLFLVWALALKVGLGFAQDAVLAIHGFGLTWGPYRLR